MNKIGSYEIELTNISPKQWEFFLKKNSNLPGGKTNIELAKAFARIGTLMDFKKYIQLGPQKAPKNSEEEFLVFCSVLGYGQYLSGNHDDGLLQQLRERANDPRWRIRKAVTMALQTVGKKRISRMLKYARLWLEGSCLEQRAAVTALCEPSLLTTREVCLEVLELLDLITATIVQREPYEEGYGELQEALGSCWSVVVAALPEKGKPMMERWMKEKHPIIKKIIKENLQKKRLLNIDPAWTTKWIQKLSN